MFMSVNHAIETAYYSQIKTPYKQPNIFNATTPSKVGEPVTWEDLATKAGMVFQILREQLSPDDLLLLDALKITPETESLEMRKVEAIMSVTNSVAKKVNIDKQYIFCVVAQYCGMNTTRSEEHWAHLLKKSSRTLRRFRNGTASKPGINGLLDNQTNVVFSRLLWRFKELKWLT